MKVRDAGTGIWDAGTGIWDWGTGIWERGEMKRAKIQRKARRRQTNAMKRLMAKGEGRRDMGKFEKEIIYTLLINIREMKIKKVQ